MLQNISLYGRNQLIRVLRECLGSWKNYHAAVAAGPGLELRAPTKQLPGPPAFREGARLSIADYLDAWLSL